MPDKRTIVWPLILWLLADLIVLIPGGVVTQVNRAEAAIQAQVVASPLGKLCYICGAPAVQFARYTDGSIRYFCSAHTPPEEMRATSPGEHGDKMFNPKAIFIVLGLVFGIGTYRSVIHLVTQGEKLTSTVFGAVIGLALALGAWFWFSLLVSV